MRFPAYKHDSDFCAFQLSGFTVYKHSEVVCLCVQEPGKFNLTLVVMPSCWLGCNASAPVAFNALKQTAAERAGKGPARGRDKNAPKFLDDDEVRLLKPDSFSRIRNRASCFFTWCFCAVLCCAHRGILAGCFGWRLRLPMRFQVPQFMMVCLSLT